jgi:hypothetical protein
MIKHISIAGRKLKVLHLPLTDLSGSYHHDAQTISLSTDLEVGSEAYVLTIAHELVHAALWISGVGFGLPDGADEQITRCMEQLFLPTYDKLRAGMPFNGVLSGSEASEGEKQGKDSGKGRKPRRRAGKA